MNIGIDGNEANLSKRVGVGQYAYNILLELSRLKSNNNYFIYLKSQPLKDLPPESSNWHYIVFGPQKLWTKIALPFHLYLSSQKLDLFYTPAHYSPHFCPFPTVPTIHDLGYLETPSQFTQKDFYQLKNWTEHSIKKAVRIMAVSEFTKNEIVRIYNISPKIIDVVYNGLGTLPPTSPDVLTKFKIKKPYFLYLGTLKPNKNIPFLISAFSSYLKLYRSKALTRYLVIAGKKGWQFDEIYTKVEKLKLTDSVIFTDFITESEKYSLLQNAAATVLPSLYEGFGIPAIEAQLSGSPVIASRIPPFVEILKDTALFIDPLSESTLIQALNLVTTPKIRSNLIKKGKINAALYPWSNSAKALLKAFNTI